MKKTLTLRQFARLGGKARAASLTSDERKALARKAIAKRWEMYRERKEHSTPSESE